MVSSLGFGEDFLYNYSRAQVYILYSYMDPVGN